ncbi:MAG TPA: NF038122 family metalloprotease [Verrucomicrobiae bacterium]|nr:NF038122 family metalloprotease [Verrucomicrobiae bacterium]
MKTTPALCYVTASLLVFAFASARLHAQTELIINGGFESGETGWTVDGGAGVYSDLDYARSGSGFLYLGGVEYEVDSAYQTIIIPANAVNAALTFYYNILTYEDTPYVYDTFTATIEDASGATLATVGNWSNVDADNNIGPSYYHQVTFNLLPYAGQAIRITFSSQNDDYNPTAFDIDDVSVQINTDATPPPNDACAGAIAMDAGTTYTLNTAQATSAGDPASTCQSSSGKGVWYSYTPASSGLIVISTCGSSFDTTLSVFTGSCGSLTPIACNDDNGPACSGSQASVNLSVSAGTTYYILAGGSGGASGNLSILASATGGLTIVPTFDSTITSDPQASTIEATINSAIALYQSTYADPITVTVTFKKMGSGLGQSSTYYNSFPYSDYYAALVGHATTTDDATALAHLPNSYGNPVTGDGSMYLTLPLARALGFSDADTPAGQTDGTIFLNTSITTLAGPTAPGKFSLYATICHEMDEVLGFVSELNGLNNGDPAPTGPVSPGDLFRYDGAGARSFTTDLNAASYFSIDGATDLVRFNQHAGGDFQDWYSYNGTATPRVQDAYATPGASPVPNVELRVLDVIGYTRIVPPPPTLTMARSGNNVVIAWPTSADGYTLQSTTSLKPASWVTVSPAPTIVNGKYTVTNSLAGAAKFYRLTK